MTNEKFQEILLQVRQRQRTDRDRSWDEVAFDLGDWFNDLTKEQVYTFGQELGRNEKIKALIAGPSIDGRHLKYLTKILKTNTTITEFNLDCDLREENWKSWKYLAEMLKTNTTINALSLSNIIYFSINAIFYKKVDEMLDALETNTTISDHSILDYSSRYFVRFIDVLKNNKTLKLISFENCNIDDVRMELLTEALENNTTLLKFFLTLHHFSEKSTGYLANMLKNNTTLEYLNLEGCEIDDNNMSCLMKSLKHNKTLTTLYMGDVEFEKVGLMSLLKTLKNNITLRDYMFGRSVIDLFPEETYHIRILCTANLRISEGKYQEALNKLLESGIDNVKETIQYWIAYCGDEIQGMAKQLLYKAIKDFVEEYTTAHSIVDDIIAHEILQAVRTEELGNNFSMNYLLGQTEEQINNGEKSISPQDLIQRVCDYFSNPKSLYRRFSIICETHDGKEEITEQQVEFPLTLLALRSKVFLGMFNGIQIENEDRVHDYSGAPVKFFTFLANFLSGNVSDKTVLDEETYNFLQREDIVAFYQLDNDNNNLLEKLCENYSKKSVKTEYSQSMRQSLLQTKSAFFNQNEQQNTLLEYTPNLELAIRMLKTELVFFRQNSRTPLELLSLDSNQCSRK